MKPSIAYFLPLLPSTLGATIYLAGDSTMAPGGGGSGTDGTSTTTLSILNKHRQTDSNRMGRIHLLLHLRHRLQQSPRRPQCPLLHPRRPLRRNRQHPPKRRLRGDRIRPQRRRLAIFGRRQRPHRLSRYGEINLQHGIQRSIRDRAHLPGVHSERGEAVQGKGCFGGCLLADTE